MNVTILGSGNVGRALARGARAAKLSVRLLSARKTKKLPPLAPGIFVLAVRDPEIPKWVSQLVESDCSHVVVTLVSGSLSLEKLDPIRKHARGVARMHPFIAFASTSASPDLDHGFARIDGNAMGKKQATALAKKLGLTPFTAPHVDPVLYHSAAAILANGAAALTAIATDLLRQAHIPAALVAPLLGSLLESVASNVSKLGSPLCLTGPVRRGDEKAVAAMLETVATMSPHRLQLIRESLLAQVAMAREIGEATPAALKSIEQMSRTSSK